MLDWPELESRGFVFECDEFGKLDGCVCCGDDTWLNVHARCCECDDHVKAEEAEDKLENDAARLVCVAIGLPLTSKSISQIPRRMVVAKAEHLRVLRSVRAKQAANLRPQEKDG